MKKFLVGIAVAFLALTASLPVEARQKGDRFQRDDSEEVQSSNRRSRDSREEGRESRRGRNDYLTPEEREQLRDDINRHGRDIYRERDKRR